MTDKDKEKRPATRISARLSGIFVSRRYETLESVSPRTRRYTWNVRARESHRRVILSINFGVVVQYCPTSRSLNREGAKPSSLLTIAETSMTASTAAPGLPFALPNQIVWIALNEIIVTNSARKFRRDAYILRENRHERQLSDISRIFRVDGGNEHATIIDPPGYFLDSPL